jgi:mRNA interferase MazF
MLTSGDVWRVDLDVPRGREAGFPRPGVVVTAQLVLDQSPSVVHVVPTTTTLRGFGSEVVLEPAESDGLAVRSAAQCQHLRAVSVERLTDRLGHVGPEALARIRETIADLLDL